MCTIFSITSNLPHFYASTPLHECMRNCKWLLKTKKIFLGPKYVKMCKMIFDRGSFFIWNEKTRKSVCKGNMEISELTYSHKEMWIVKTDKIVDIFEYLSLHVNWLNISLNCVMVNWLVNWWYRHFFMLI